MEYNKTMSRKLRFKILSIIGLFTTILSLSFSALPTIAAVSVANKVPGAPTITNVNNNFDSQLIVTFTPGFDGGSPITGYQYSTDEGYTWRDFGPVTSNQINIVITSQPIVTPLISTVSYNLRLRAINAIGFGAPTTKNKIVMVTDGYMATPSNCSQYIFIGLRGSGELFVRGSAVGEMGLTLGQVFVTLANTPRFLNKIKYDGIAGYEAASVSLYNKYLQNMVQGKIPFNGEVSRIHAWCPTSELILAGYSQGAFVVHDYMATQNNKHADISYIGSVFLLADPAKPGTGLVAFGNSTGIGMALTVKAIQAIAASLEGLHCALGSLISINACSDSGKNTILLLNSIASGNVKVKPLPDITGVPFYQYALPDDIVANGNIFINNCLNQIVGLIVGIAPSACVNLIHDYSVHTSYSKSAVDNSILNWIVLNTK